MTSASGWHRRLWRRRLPLWLVPPLAVALVVAGSLGGRVGAASLIAVALALLATRPPRVAAAIVAIAATVAVVGTLGTLETGAGRSSPRAQAEAAWQRVIAHLGETAHQVAAGFPAPADESRTARLAAFEELARRYEPHRGEDSAFVLVDPDGEAWAWAGEGLLDEPRADEIPREGFTVSSGWGSSTVVAVAPVGAVRRPWRVLVGRSWGDDSFPGAVDPLPELRWRAFADAADVAGADQLITSAQVGAPGAAIDWRAESVRTAAARPVWVLLLALATCPLLAWSLAETRRPWLTAVAGGAIVAILGSVGAVAPAALATAGLATTAVLLAVRLERQRSPLLALAPVVGGAAAMIAVGLLVVHERRELGDLLAPGRAPVPEAVAWWLGATAGLLAALLWASSRRLERDRSGLLAGVLALSALAAVLADRPVASLCTAALAAVVAAVWASAAERRSGAVLATLLFLAPLLVAIQWEAARRAALAAAAPEHADRLAGPGDEAFTDLAARLDEALAVIPLESISPFAGGADLVSRDLAAGLWKASALSRIDAFSAIVAVPPAGEPSSFSVGLPLTQEGELDAQPVNWRELDLPGRDQLLLGGEGVLTRRGSPWGRLRWWALPLPGASLERYRPRDVRSALLRGTGSLRTWRPELPVGLAFALVGADGRAVAAPWTEVPPVEVDRQIVSTPTGPMRAHLRPTREGGRALVFVPRSRPLVAIERACALALGALLVLLPILLLGRLGTVAVPSLGAALLLALRSYPRRLAIAYGLLLLIPLLILQVFFTGVLAGRLRAEQRMTGEAALGSAERVLGEYVETLRPGFGLVTELDDGLLGWLSRVVRHDLNLYWGATLSASSKRELVGAGLLPRRIPGDIYASLALRGRELAARTSRAGDAAYLELYAPVPITGQPSGGSGLFLSMPLLDRQESIELEIAELRRQSVVVSALLFLIMLAVGIRLTRGFTRPIAEIVSGTRRIAGGAASLDVEPEELELAESARAIDDMARSIAEGRARLVQGKQVVDRMIENITAGVVSIDREGRVVLTNRLAAELLGVEPGLELGAALHASTRLGPLACFLDDVRGGPLAERTVRIAAPNGERDWRAVWVPLPPGSDPAGLVVVEDATESLRAERLQAWAEMARIIAHEIKNPLTPIRLSAEHLREVWRREPERVGEALERCVSNILRQVEELRLISTEFSTYARIPRIEKIAADLVAFAAELVVAYADRPAGGVELVLVAPEGPIEADFDPRLLGRALRNLIENAIRASVGGTRVEVVVEDRGSSVQLAVRDRGPGVPESQLGRIFDPYFSTHDTGTGLGLPITRRIIEEHGGEIRATNREGGGLDVTCTIPRR